MKIEGVRANLVSQGMKVLFSPLRVRKSYAFVDSEEKYEETEQLYFGPQKEKSPSGVVF